MNNPQRVSRGRRSLPPRPRNRRRVNRRNASRSGVGGLAGASVTNSTFNSQIGPNIRAFPDVLHTQMRMTTRLSTSSTGVAHTFKGNSLYQVGPQVDWGGAFGANYPSDLTFLLSTPFATGSNAPYSRYRVFASSILVRVVQNSNVAADVVVWPSTAPSFLGMAVTNIMEQDYAKTKQLPAGTSAAPLVLHSRQTSMSEFGYHSREVLRGDDSTIGSVSTTTPTRTWFWNVFIGPSDGLSTLGAYIDYTIIYDVEFFSRNQGNTAGPSLTVRDDDQYIHLPSSSTQVVPTPVSVHTNLDAPKYRRFQ